MRRDVLRWHIVKRHAKRHLGASDGRGGIQLQPRCRRTAAKQREIARQAQRVAVPLQQQAPAIDRPAAPGACILKAQGQRVGFHALQTRQAVISQYLVDPGHEGRQIRCHPVQRKRVPQREPQLTRAVAGQGDEGTAYAQVAQHHLAADQVIGSQADLDIRQYCDGRARGGLHIDIKQDDLGVPILFEAQLDIAEKHTKTGQRFGQPLLDHAAHPIGG